jgi:dolichol kinase
MHMCHKFDVDTRLVGVHFFTFLDILAKYHFSLNEYLATLFIYELVDSLAPCNFFLIPVSHIDA